jgi:integrase
LLTIRPLAYHDPYRSAETVAKAGIEESPAEKAMGSLGTPSVRGIRQAFEQAVNWASTHVSPKTVESVIGRGLIGKQIRPHIGNRPIQKLRAVDLSELYAKLLREPRSKTEAKGLAPRTVGHVHRLLHRALGHAATWGVVQQNVASLVSPPRVSSTEIEIIREDEIKAVLQKLRGRSMYMIATLGLATGMRRGELLALRWQDVDLDGGKLRVERSVEQTEAGLRFKSPKTRHGRRPITLPPSAVAVLREWSLAVKAAGVPAVTLHSLRHSMLRTLSPPAMTC